MTEMQRFFLSDDGVLREYESGPYVRFTDAEAAISAARADATVWQAFQRGVKAGYATRLTDVADLVREAKADMLAKCIAAVEALEPLLFVDKHHGGYDCCGCSTLDALHEDALAALRALEEKP